MFRVKNALRSLLLVALFASFPCFLPPAHGQQAQAAATIRMGQL
jgi:hypothetical protein